MNEFLMPLLHASIPNELYFRESGNEALGIDWSTSHFLRIINEDQIPHVIENPRHLKARKYLLASRQRMLSRKKKGSKNRKKAWRKLASAFERLAWKREDFLHQMSASLIRKARLIAKESLNIKNMTAHGGAYKKGLNRSILDIAPSMFFRFLEYKAADAGILYIEVPTRKIKPSQTCSSCGKVEKNC
ncbi:MAG: transposase [Proteobacteria bacterium]|nr:MAG: transposase [Pseudomonadota bacterium]